jgi:DNA-binding transcriptional LysR family regulator
MYALPPVLRRLKTDHPQLEINLKAGLTAATLQMLKANALDLRLCALPVDDPAFETIPLFEDPLVAILPAKTRKVPKKITPVFLSRCPLILVNEESALRRTVREWLEHAGPAPKPLMEFDHVEAIKSVGAVGLGCSVVPKMCLGRGHVGMAGMMMRPLSPSVGRDVGLVRLRGKRVKERSRRLLQLQQGRPDQVDTVGAAVARFRADLFRNNLARMRERAGMLRVGRIVA